MNPVIKNRLNQIRSGKVPAGYKQTKIGIIPEDWKIKQLNKIAPLQRGFDLPNYEINEGLYPVCYSNGIMRLHNEYKVNGPGVFTGRSGTIGKVFYVEDNFWPHNTSLWVTDFFNNYPKFIYYFYSNLRFERFLAGTGVPTLNRNDVHITKRGVPESIPEQRRIAEILSTWDTALELKEKLLEQKKLQKKGLMQQLLTGTLRTINPQTGKPFEGEWQEVRLGSVTEQVTRFVDFDDNKLYSLVSVRRRSEGLFFRESLLGNQILTKNLQQIKENDFLISKMQIVHGASGLVMKEFDGAYVSNSYIILRCKDSLLDVSFFDYYSKQTYFYHLTYVSSYGVHIEKMTFNLRLFLKEKIKIPKMIHEQQAIAAILTQADQEIVLLEIEIEHLKEQKRGLMQLLLTGVVRV